MRKTLMGAVLAGMALAPLTASADPVEEFYRGKQVRLILGFATGGGDDSYGRLLAKHMPKYIPGAPQLLIQNQPGAGSLTAANAIYNLAPRDGTTFGMTHRFVPLMPLLGIQGPKFDPQKFTYIGSMNREIGLCIAMKTTGFKSMDDMKTREFLGGTTGAGAELTTFYATLQNMLGAKIKVIKGYQSSSQVNIAMERGEVQGRCGVSFSSLKSSKPDWLEENKIDILLQLGLHKDPELPHVPLLADIVTDDRDHRALQLLLGPSEIGRPFMGPPEMPDDRVAALRKAFMQAVKDPEMTKDAKLQRLDLEPVDGAEMATRVADFYKAPESVVARTRELVAAGGGE